MKKRTLIERKKALKEAYYNELKKREVIDTPVTEEAKPKKKTTKKKVEVKEGEEDDK